MDVSSLVIPSISHDLARTRSRHASVNSERSMGPPPRRCSAKLELVRAATHTPIRCACGRSGRGCRAKAKAWLRAAAARALKNLGAGPGGLGPDALAADGVRRGKVDAAAVCRADRLAGLQLGIPEADGRALLAAADERGSDDLGALAHTVARAKGHKVEIPAHDTPRG